jgi:glycosyltransferase involved in cell wall biosynthesis
MKLLYVYAGLKWWWDYEERMAANVNRTQSAIHITFWNWLREYGLGSNPGSLVWAQKNRDALNPFYNELRRRAKEHDVVLISQTGGILPEVMADLPAIVVYSSTDDPDSSEICSFPFLKVADVVAHAAVNYDRRRRLKDVFLERGANRCVFWPIGFYEETFPPLPDFDAQFGARDIDLIYVGHLKRGKLERLMRTYRQMHVYGRSLGLKHKLYVWAFTRKWVRPFTGDLSSLYRRAKIGINMHFTSGPCNGRCYQLNAAGTAQVIDCPEGVDELYVPEEEVIVYSGMDEAIAAIDRLLRDPSLRYKVSKQGYHRARRQYGRSQTLLRLLEQLT